MKPGDKVHYIKSEGKSENGIIQRMHPTLKNHAWIVFHCGNDWKNYKNYTGMLMSLDLVKKGWK